MVAPFAEEYSFPLTQHAFTIHYIWNSDHQNMEKEVEYIYTYTLLAHKACLSQEYNMGAPTWMLNIPTMEDYVECAQYGGL